MVRAAHHTSQGKTHWKVGELARLTGVSVRALHHYDAIGLLSPSARSESGYRLYTKHDISRLEQIVSLRAIGFSLEEANAALQEAHFSPRHVVEMHLTRLRNQIENEQRLLAQLEMIKGALESQEDVSSEQFLQLIKAITMIEKYYTPQQLEHMAQRREALGEEAIKSVENEWPQLIAKVRAAMENGEDPSSPAVLALARRWNELVDLFTGGDPGIRESLGKMYGDAMEQGTTLGPNPDAMPTPELMAYIGPVIEAVKNQ